MQEIHQAEAGRRGGGGGGGPGGREAERGRKRERDEKPVRIRSAFCKNVFFIISLESSALCSAPEELTRNY